MLLLAKYRLKTQPSVRRYIHTRGPCAPYFYGATLFHLSKQHTVPQGNQGLVIAYHSVGMIVVQGIQRLAVEDWGGGAFFDLPIWFYYPLLPRCPSWHSSSTLVLKHRNHATECIFSQCFSMSNVGIAANLVEHQGDDHLCQDITRS